MIHASENRTYPGRYRKCHPRTPEWIRLSDLIDEKVKDILDIGCSYGVETARIAAEHPHTKVIGIDIDPEVIAIANRAEWHTSLFRTDYKEWHPNFLDPSFEYVGDTTERINLYKVEGDPKSVIKLKRKPENLEFQVMDADKMTFEKPSFDLVIVCASLFPLKYGPMEPSEDYDQIVEKQLAKIMPFINPGGVLYTSEFIRRTD